MSRDRYALGVLFVHGIGAQQQGHTLTDMGDPLVEWLDRWSHGDPTARSASRPAIQPIGGRAFTDLDGGPACALLNVRAPFPEQQWLLAESYWADSFRPARFGEILNWGVVAAPIAITAHIRLIAETRLRQASGGHPASLSSQVLHGQNWVLVGFVGSALAVLVMPLLLLLSVVSLIPIPGVRSAVATLQAVLTGGVGDSFVVTSSPIRSAAIEAIVRRDVAWLTERCDAVAVVAHSQGAYVAFEALLPQAPAQVRLLLTFGGAIRKLRLLREFTRKRSRRETSAARMVTLVSSYSTMLLLMAGILDPERGPIYLVAAMILVWANQILLGNLISSLDIARVTDLKRDTEMLLTSNPEFQWLDLYASSDPVPSGPALHVDPAASDQTQPAWSRYSSQLVNNAQSVIVDHVTYWSAASDFVARTVAALFAASGAPLTDDATSDAIASAHRSRAGRVTLLLAARAVMLTSAVMFVFTADLVDYGRSALDIITTAASAVFGLIPWLGLPADDIADLRLHPALQSATTLVIALLVAAGWYWFGRAVWLAVLAHDEEALFGRRRQRVLTWPFVVFLGWLIASFLGVATWLGLVGGIGQSLLFAGISGSVTVTFAVMRGLDWTRRLVQTGDKPPVSDSGP